MTEAARESPLDDIDLALLAALRDDGRATVQTLAEKVNLSPAATSVRLTRLRERGAYRGVHADVDERAVGYELCAYLLLQIADVKDRMQLTADLYQLPEVTEVAWVTGEHDMLLTIWARDRRHLESVIETLNVRKARSRTMLVLGEVYKKPGIDFELPPTPPVSDPTLPLRSPARPQ